MPRYYCDYCDIFLTHDSFNARRAHNEGWKHKLAAKQFYSQFEEDWVQTLIDNKIRDYEQRMQGMRAIMQGNIIIFNKLAKPASSYKP
jgi:U1 small nuclear ribonucleoprotein C